MAAETRIKLTNIIAKLPEEAVVRNGHKCDKQEYRCKDCEKTFVSTTNTLMANSH